LLVETSRAYGRGILRGIARYARTQGRWSILFQDWQLEDPLPSWLGKGRCDGVIAHITTAASLRTLRRLGIPTIGVGQARPVGLARSP
jgi:LacI family transcriptional regulator